MKKCVVFRLLLVIAYALARVPRAAEVGGTMGSSSSTIAGPAGASTSSGGGGGGASQSSVGGLTQRRERLSKTKVAGQR